MQIETICMNCQILFSGKNKKKKNFSMLYMSAEIFSQKTLSGTGTLPGEAIVTTVKLI